MSKHSARETARTQRIWLKRVLDETQLAPSALAERAGVWPSTLLSFLKAPDDSARTLHAATIDKIVEVTNIAAPSSETPTQRRVIRGLRDEGQPFKNSGDSDFDRAVRALTVKRPNADPWVLTTRSLEARGYMPGDTVIVDLGQIPAAGDIVCAQIYDWKGTKAETVFRVYDPPYLIAATTDTRFQKPIVVDNERVVIKGVLLPHRLRQPEAA